MYENSPKDPQLITDQLLVPSIMIIIKKNDENRTISAQSEAAAMKT